MKEVPKELHLDGDYYELRSNGETLEKAEAIRLLYKDYGTFSIVRHYNGLFYVYVRIAKGGQDKYAVICQGGFSPYIFETTQSKESANYITGRINEHHKNSFHAWVVPIHEAEQYK